ncbi:MAG: MarR family winged helix-turn-helix transcriptional regulator [Corynebacterium sp.]|uniref:MarR family winged helix-turn-helix transcriptional regulator n=1 Tax=Candidatus Corynebacterium faecigallinarum TaxID=2838528 RepID=A0A9D2QG11_9CORY|nr:MarR family winged helix-turn-helix transcriptional regulator [Corynebacterium sp.]HJC85885.1 MarR family winged helix-turn-helix transcriptional regulator [Candidatus Corynebacterium faecigallinarum]MDN5721964.1 MarR family winged helix-turn-helix transcriptional regulator [Corynebacterium sp.]MDN6282420.1 MarR family winged helix-turn-helix transcriptional regulator [Corynebacterium sp.]MDN6305353.1 MarR family winged helix-turn-helix transcriptional regulator [Corynebacterium sp.]MDN6352
MTNSTDNSPRWLSDEEQCLWRKWLAASRRIDSELARDMQRQSGLSMSDYEVLVNLSEAPDYRMRIAALADALTWDRSRLSHQISRMIKRDLLTREACESDGRGAFIVLTQTGLSTIQQAAPGHVDSVRRLMIDRLDEQQAADLGRVLDVILEQFED